jgi:Fic family protein
MYKFETVGGWLTRIDSEVLPEMKAKLNDPTIPQDERDYISALLSLYTAAVERSRKDGDDEPTAKYIGAANITLYYEMGRTDIASLEKHEAWHREHV